MIGKKHVEEERMKIGLNMEEKLCGSNIIYTNQIANRLMEIRSI